MLSSWYVKAEKHGKEKKQGLLPTKIKLKTPKSFLSIFCLFRELEVDPCTEKETSWGQVYWGFCEAWIARHLGEQEDKVLEV